jgi:pimeloyl-ACP methyl ester carboxylesterase
MHATVVLVHGAWHGAWSWQPVTRRLRSKTLDVVAVDLPGHGASTEPLGDFDDDVATVTAALDAIDGPVVLAGHSYGGAVITSAGDHANVVELAYVAAFAPDRNETVAGLAEKYPIEHAEAPMRMDGDTIVLTEHGLHDVLYHDCSGALDTARRMIVPENPAKLSTPVDAPAWRSKPTTYVRCTKDRIVHPDLQLFMAERAGAKLLDLHCGHLPQFAAADELTTILTELARG